MPGLSAPISLDGAHLEGAGALVRTALTMAALTQQPVRIFDVRGNAPYPGVAAEDMAILRGLALATGAETAGDVGDHELYFAPTRRPVGLTEKFETPEAGDGHANALVVLLSLLPAMSRSGVYSKLSVQGETYGHHVLSFDYFAAATLGALRRLGLYAFPEMPMAGFGRGSRGEVRLETEPSALTGVDWSKRGELISAGAIVAVGNLPSAVAGRGVAHLERLASHGKVPLSIDWIEVPSRTPGAHVTVWAEYEGGWGGAASMGRKGLRMESVAQSAHDAFMEWHSGEATVDPFLADQILVTAAIAEGPTTFRVSRITQRFLTVVWAIKQFLPIRITVRGHEGEPGLVTIQR